jgi:hypothetical protein
MEILIGVSFQLAQQEELGRKTRSPPWRFMVLVNAASKMGQKVLRYKTFLNYKAKLKLVSSGQSSQNSMEYRVMHWVILGSDASTMRHKHSE